MVALTRAIRAIRSSRTAPQLATAARYALLAVKQEVPRDLVPPVMDVFDDTIAKQSRRIGRRVAR